VQTVGVASAPVTTVLNNLGPGNLNVSSIAVTGANAVNLHRPIPAVLLLRGEFLHPEDHFHATLANRSTGRDHVITTNATGSGQTVALVEWRRKSREVLSACGQTQVPGAS